MPVIVDKQKIRNGILDAFEQCINDKPIFNITLRDIAEKAGMSHQNLLSYFKTKDDLLFAYCEYTKQYMVDHCKNWFSDHKREQYESNSAYLNAFMEYVAEKKTGENRPNATVQTYVLAQYDERIRALIIDEFRQWRNVMEQCLNEIYGETDCKKEAEAMMILITGTFMCNYNKALSGSINNAILSSLDRLVE